MISIINPVLPKVQQDLIEVSPTLYFNSILSLVLNLSFFVAVFYFLWHFFMGAYHLIASQGDPKAVETAQKTLTHAFVGLGIVFSIFAILRLISTVFGLTDLGGLLSPPASHTTPVPNMPKPHESPIPL